MFLKLYRLAVIAKQTNQHLPFTLRVLMMKLLGSRIVLYYSFQQGYDDVNLPLLQPPPPLLKGEPRGPPLENFKIFPIKLLILSLLDSYAGQIFSFVGRE